MKSRGGASRGARRGEEAEAAVRRCAALRDADRAPAALHLAHLTLLDCARHRRRALRAPRCRREGAAQAAAAAQAGGALPLRRTRPVTTSWTSWTASTARSTRAPSWTPLSRVRRRLGRARSERRRAREKLLSAGPPKLPLCSRCHRSDSALRSSRRVSSELTQRNPAQCLPATRSRTTACRGSASARWRPPAAASSLRVRAALRRKLQSAKTGPCTDALRTGRRVLTNAHSVDHATQVKLKHRGSETKVRGAAAARAPARPDATGSVRCTHPGHRHRVRPRSAHRGRRLVLGGRGAHRDGQAAAAAGPVHRCWLPYRRRHD